VFTYKLAVFLLPHLSINASWLTIPRPTFADMKRHLSGLRLIHFLSVAYVTTVCIRPTSRILHWPISKPLILGGQHSLEIFSMTVVLAMVDNIAVMAFQPHLAERVFFDCLALSVMILATFGLARNNASAKRA
jgi:hypothetical protein